MHFQVISDEYYEGILNRLKEIVPEFNSVFDEEDGIYPILGEFGTYLADNAYNDNIFENGVKFINEALTTGKNDTEDLIVLQLFHKFYENPLLTEKIRTDLDVRAKSIFDKYLVEYNKGV